MRRQAVTPDGTLTDTGPLFALVDTKGQQDAFARCQAVLPALPRPLVTTWPYLSEVMHLTGQTGGWPMRRLVARMVTTGALRLYDLSPAETDRALALMEQYRDRPMDLADETLVVAAEARGDTQIFSLDSDFYVYRLADGRALTVVPGPAPTNRSRR